MNSFIYLLPSIRKIRFRGAKIRSFFKLLNFVRKKTGAIFILPFDSFKTLNCDKNVCLFEAAKIRGKFWLNQIFVQLFLIIS
ncbi:MAG TPA: hypothetical protein DCR43_02710 [Bacteroidales bacterium]|nr:MAG: hypothetical protein A2X11_07180 [Bacteroidetes bacterium GWE2_42_24]OFY29550.1 MAG: hypothetical protein A2X09_04420 [Bacteroidetes bacterium GWF2_43_11]HAQ64755.1 hypothetical protein [Bacteroidales bacterium]HBZ67353.1 hypothetical protein [Bacteroidales bacterium]